MVAYPDLSDDDVNNIRKAMDFFDKHLRGKRAIDVPIVKELFGDQFQLLSNSNFTKEKWPTKRNTFLLERTITIEKVESKKYYPLKYTVHLALGIPEWKGKFTSNRLETKIKATSIKYVHKEENEDWLEDKGVDIWGDDSSEVKETKSIVTNKSPSVKIEDIKSIIMRRKLVVLEGVPGTGKTHIYESIKENFGHATFLTFHPSSDYSTFVGGIRPGENKTTGGLEFNPTKGHLLKILDEARAIEGSVLLWIDELNRANVPRVFGDLISLIGNKDPPDLHIPNVGLKKDNDNEILALSSNQVKRLHIVATMNTSDRSVTPLDAALRRRFNFIRLHPMGEEELFTTDSKDDFRRIKDDITCFENLNICLNENMGADAMMGHSYLFEMSKFADDDSKRKLLWKFSILPNIIDTLLISQNFELINEINTIIKNNTGLKLVDSAQDGVGKGLGRMILVEGVSK
jgi:hypothetical protein